jgi:heterodisulfide reductase subunit B
MRYSYFPGCSLESGGLAHAYHQSLMAVTEKLGIELVEVEDWNCCGATEYISLNRLASYALITRNLAQAAKLAVDTPNGGDLKQLVAPCSACYLNLNKCDHYLHDDPRLAERVNEALSAGGMSYKPGSVKVRHLLDVIVNDVGYGAVSEHVTKPLQGLRVAPYYGCLIGRPRLNGKVDDPEYPVTLDRLLTALGADVVDYPMKANCCGGHMTQISEGVAFDMIRYLIKGAADAQADLIVTACPMCQLNLDAFQGAMNRHFKTDYHVPVLYYTQMMGLAFGLPAPELGIGSELVDARAALARIGTPPPAESTPARKPRRPKEELPMPKLLDKEAA